METKNRPLLALGILAGLIGIIMIAVFVALGGPLRNMFSSAVGTSTMGQNQAALAAGIYGDAADCRLAQTPFNTEQYNLINENTFRDVKIHPVSTFSIDVDRASYANVRRFLGSGALPPRDAVRIEEMINYFTYDYPQPDGRDPFSIVTEASACPWNPAHHLVLVGLQGRTIPPEDLPPSNLVFLLDVSGSMQSPDKLPLLKSAFRLLVNRLSPRDRVAIVVYAGSSGLVLPSTSGNRKAEILDAIDRLEAGGSTAGAAGIEQAYAEARQNFIPGGNNRVILATDGDFNVGISSDGELVELIEKKRGEGVYLTVLGFGTGNLKDSKMELLADKGNGNYSYIDSLEEAQKVLVAEMGGTLHAIARDVKIQVEFNPLRVKAYRLIGYENRLLAREDFEDDAKDAGELGSGHTVTALYEIVPAGSDEEVRSASPLVYQRSVVTSRASENVELMTVQLRYKFPQETASRLLSRIVSLGSNPGDEASDNLRFAAAVAEFGMLLRQSEFKGSATYGHALALAQRSMGPDKEGYRREFTRLIEQAAALDHRVEDAPLSSNTSGNTEENG